MFQLKQFIALIFCMAMMSTSVLAVDQPPEMDGIGIEEHLGETVQIHQLHFRDESAQSVKLADYFKKDHPVVLALIYFECPKLCSLVMNGLLDTLKKLEWRVGEEFEVIAVSIDPKETSELASQKRLKYIESYHVNKTPSPKGWHFLTGEEDQIRALAAQVGFKYRYDESEKQYLHAASLFILTPEGKISRYLYGISFQPRDLRMALSEASHGKIGSLAERVLLFCFHYDPDKNSYSFQVWRVVQIILMVQAIVLGVCLFVLWKKERKLPH